MYRSLDDYSVNTEFFYFETLLTYSSRCGGFSITAELGDLLVEITHVFR